MKGNVVGVYVAPDAKFTISAGTITGDVPTDTRSFAGAVFYSIPDGVDPDGGAQPVRPGTEEEITAACLAPGSCVLSGGFRDKNVVVARMPLAADLPQTGDPSMLGAWAMLLGASALGLKKRGKKS